VKVQIIANVQLEVTQVLIATSQYVLMSTIVHPMDYALEQTIVLVSLDGRIKIVVHFTVINKTIVHIQKEHAMDQINVIAQVNGLEVIAIHQFATLSVLWIPMSVLEMETVPLLINANVKTVGLVWIVNFPFAMESMLPMHLFATHMVLVYPQTIAHAAMDLLEMIANTFFVMDCRTNLQMFVHLMETVYPQTIVIVPLNTLEAIVNSQSVLVYHPI
jgi:hypothetical protein